MVPDTRSLLSLTQRLPGLTGSEGQQATLTRADFPVGWIVGEVDQRDRVTDDRLGVVEFVLGLAVDGVATDRVRSIVGDVPEVGIFWVA